MKMKLIHLVYAAIGIIMLSKIVRKVLNKD